MADNMSNFR